MNYTFLTNALISTMLAILVITPPKSDSPPPAKTPIDRDYLVARCAFAERVAARHLLDYMRAAFLNGKMPEVDRIGPALRRLFDAAQVLAVNSEDRLANAERYNRLVSRFAHAERQVRDSGQLPDSNYQMRSEYYLFDSATEIVKARRAAGLKAPVSDNEGWVAPRFTIENLIGDLFSIALSFIGYESQGAEIGSIPPSKEVLEALKEFRTDTPPNRDEELTKLLWLRSASAASNLQLYSQVFQAGAKKGTLHVLLDSLKLRLAAELELSTRLSDQVKAHERAYTIAKWIEPICDARFKAGEIHETDRDLARYHRLDYQIQWMRAKARLDAESKKPK